MCRCFLTANNNSGLNVAASGTINTAKAQQPNEASCGSGIDESKIQENSLDMDVKPSNTRVRGKLGKPQSIATPRGPIVGVEGGSKKSDRKNASFEGDLDPQLQCAIDMYKAPDSSASFKLQLEQRVLTKFGYDLKAECDK